MCCVNETDALLDLVNQVKKGFCEYKLKELVANDESLNLSASESVPFAMIKILNNEIVNGTNEAKGYSFQAYYYPKGQKEDYDKGLLALYDNLEDALLYLYFLLKWKIVKFYEDSATVVYMLSNSRCDSSYYLQLYHHLGFETDSVSAILEDENEYKTYKFKAKRMYELLLDVDDKLEKLIMNL